MLLSFAASYLLSYFISPVFADIGAILLTAVLFMYVPGASLYNRRLSLLLFAVGSVLLLFWHIPFSVWRIALGYNSGLVTLFIVLPLISFPLAYDDYEPALRSLSNRYIRSIKDLSGFAALLSYFLSAILNVGALPVIKNLLSGSAGILKADSELCKAMMRGNSAVTFWSPNYVAVAVVLNITGLPWLSILPAGLLLSLGYLFINWLNLQLKNKKGVQTHLAVAPDAGVGWEEYTKLKLWKLAGVLLSLILLVVAFNLLTEWSFLIIMAVIALVYPPLWAMADGKTDVYCQEISKYYHTSILKIENEIALFAAAGFFGKTLEITGAGKYVLSFLLLHGINRPALAVFVIIFIMIFLSLVGLHPIISSSIIASAVAADSLGLSLQAFALSLLAGYGLAVTASPFSGTTLILSGLTKEHPVVVGPRNNLFYVIELTLLYALLIPLIA